MATGFGRALGSFVAGDGTTHFTSAFTTAVDVPEGEHVIIGVGYAAQPGNNPLTSVAATGMSFAQDSVAISTLDSPAGRFRAYLFSAPAPIGGLPSGTTITVTTTLGVFALMIAGMTLTGVSSDWQDGTGTDEFTTAAWAADVTTTGPEGAIVGVAWTDRNTSHSAAAGFTEALELDSAGDGITLAMVYKVNQAAALYSPGGTFGAAAVTEGMGASAGYAAMPPAFSTRLSGGASNADPERSYGGVESSVAVALDPSDSGLFSTISTTEAAQGHTDYRCIYVRNDDSISLDVAAFVKTQLPGSLALALGVATEAAGVTVAATASPTTAPAGVTFSSPTTLGAAISLGTIPAGSSRGLWIRRTIPSSTATSTTDPWEIGFGVTPL